MNYYKLYYENHKQQFIDNARKWHFANPSKRAEIMRAFHYWRKYGITPKIYKKMLDKQNGGCAICGRKDNNKSCDFLDVDENPISHLPRGLVCNACNRSIGQYENMRLKDEKLTEKIEKYLVKYDVGYYNLL